MAGLLDIDSVDLPGFGLESELRAGSDSGWHAHGKHQLLYASAGTLKLEGDGGEWLFPPQRAAWIPSGVAHRVRTDRPASLSTVYFAPEVAPGAVTTCSVFIVPPVAREMILYSMRWGPERAPGTAADRLFEALAALCGEWAREARPWRLPVAKTPPLRRAMDHALSNLGDAPTVESAARAAGLSPRTLARRFAAEAQTTWQKYLHAARMLRAMEILVERSANVTEAACSVGFESLGAFSSAFKDFTGESPRDYQRRAGAGSRPAR